MTALGAILVPCAAAFAAVSPNSAIQARGGTAVSGSAVTPPSAAFKSVSSQSGLTTSKAATTRSVRSSASAADRAVAASAVKPRTASGTTIYVAIPALACATETGTGTAANPYCKVQDGVNAAAAGDTVQVDGSAGYSAQEAVTVTTSNISIVGLFHPQISPTNGNSGHPAITLNGVTGVSVSGLSLESSNGPTVKVASSSGVVIDSVQIGNFTGSAGGVVVIDGASNGVTVSRALLSGNWYDGTNSTSFASTGIEVDAGAKNVTLASNVIGPFHSESIAAAGVSGLDVVGNTIQRGCGGAVSVTGASTAVSIENNLLEDANPTTDYTAPNSWEAGCKSLTEAWAPDITVDATAAPATTADHNDFYLYSTDDTAPYSWSGTTYATIAAFQTGASQGAHDTNETKQYTWIGTGSGYIDAAPVPGAAALSSANTSAPGAVNSDFYGHSPYVDRGAVQFDDELNGSIGASPVGGYSLLIDGSAQSSISGVSIANYQYLWGDGSQTPVTAGSPNTGKSILHTFPQAGLYELQLLVTDSNGYKDTISTWVKVTYTDDHVVAALTVSQTSAHGVAAVSMNSTGLASINKYSYNWGDSTTSSSSSAGTTAVPQPHAYANPGTYTVTLTVTDVYGQTASTSVAITTAGSDYTPDGPTRILDTRIGLGAPQAKLTSAAPIKLKIAGAGGVPANATAVALNLTLTDSTGGGNVAAFPDGATEQTSNLNYMPGQTVANLAIVPIAANGLIDLAKQGAGGVDMIADVEGYFSQTAGSGYYPTEPTRILDTRYAVGAPKQPLTSTAPIRLKVAGVGGVSASVTAVSLNLTLTDSTGFGNVNAYPDGGNVPTASNLNYTSGLTVANASVVPVGQDGYIDLAKQGPGSVNMIADVEGYFTTGGPGAYIPLSPTRLFDSRNPSTPGKLPAGFYYALPIDTTTGGTAIPGITSWVLNTTVTDVTDTGFLTVFPDNTNGGNGHALVPNASNLNFSAKVATVPNLTFAVPGLNGFIDFYNGALHSSLDLIVDAFGAFQNG